MGLALPPHGNLEVERYIGSCLISTRVRTPNAYKPLNKIPHHNYKQKHVSLHSNQQRIFRNNQRPINKLAPKNKFYNVGLTEETASGNFDNVQKSNQSKPDLFPEHAIIPNVGKPGWTTGMPLISVEPPVHINVNNGKHSLKKNKKYNNYCMQSVIPDDSDLRMPQNNRSQFSKLAIHTQGVPLIQSGTRYHQFNKQRNYNKNAYSCNGLYRGNDFVVDKAASKNGGKLTFPQNNGKDPSSIPRTSDCLSVNSDENLSCNSSENSLPRIIKPRKRRKKDRKPNNGSGTDHPAASTNGDVNNNSTKEIVKSGEQDAKSNKSVAKEETTCDSKNVNIDDKKNKQCSNLVSQAVRLLFLDDQNVSEPPSSAILGNLDEIISGGGDKNENTAEYSAGSAISCQCRYCDPSGIIWNVDRRSYSPSLISSASLLQDFPPDPSFPPPNFLPLKNGIDPHQPRTQFSPESPAFQIPESPKSPHFRLPFFRKFPPMKSGANFFNSNLRHPKDEPFQNRPHPHSSSNFSHSSRIQIKSTPQGVKPVGNGVHFSAGVPLNGSKMPMGKPDCFSGLPKNFNGSPEVFREKPADLQFLSHADFTERIHNLSVSNFQNVLAPKLINTSRPPPLIYAKCDEPPFQKPVQMPPVPLFNINLEGNSKENQRNDAAALFHSDCEKVLKENQILLSSMAPYAKSGPQQIDAQSQKQLNANAQFMDNIGSSSGSCFRRSWSEPSYDKFPPFDNVSSRGRSASDCYEPSASPVGSQNLEISSEIVTSPNGHRDIEIKFFMSSTSSSSNSSSLSSSPLVKTAVSAPTIDEFPKV